MQPAQQVGTGHRKSSLGIHDIERGGRAVFVIVLHHGKDFLRLADIGPGGRDGVRGSLQLVVALLDGKADLLFEFLTLQPGRECRGC